MVGEFSLIVLRKGNVLRTPKEFFDLGRDIINLLEGTPVSIKEFDDAFITTNRVIVQHSKELKEIHEKILRGEMDAKSVKLNNEMFDKKKVKGIRDMAITRRPDPNYGMLDIHMVDSNVGVLNVLNISMNGFIGYGGVVDHKMRTYLNIALAKRINVGTGQDVIAIYTESNSKQIEFAIINDYSLGTKRAKTVLAKGKEVTALSLYQSITGVIVGELLMAIDKNVDTQRAPIVLSEADELIEKLEKSIKFMKENNMDKPSIDDAIQELESIKAVRRYYMKIAKNNIIRMVTMPFKLNNPGKITDFLKDGETELNAGEMEINEM